MSCLLRLSEVALVLNTFTAISPIPTFTNKIKTQLSEVVLYCGHVHLGMESYGESNIMRSHFYDHPFPLESILNMVSWKMVDNHCYIQSLTVAKSLVWRKPSLSRDVLIYIYVDVIYAKSNVWVRLSIEERNPSFRRVWQLHRMSNRNLSLYSIEATRTIYLCDTRP